METLFVIQDVKTKEYFWEYRIDNGFTEDVDQAKTYENENDCLKYMNDGYYEDTFFDRVLEIKKYYRIG